jgi:hypothetical protein
MGSVHGSSGQCFLTTFRRLIIVGSPVRNDKSLAPYRDCLGGEVVGRGELFGRGSFDRGDLKEVAGATGRAMEPQVDFESFARSDSAMRLHEISVKSPWMFENTGGDGRRKDVAGALSAFFQPVNTRIRPRTRARGLAEEWFAL